MDCTNTAVNANCTDTNTTPLLAKWRFLAALLIIGAAKSYFLLCWVPVAYTSVDLILMGILHLNHFK